MFRNYLTIALRNFWKNRIFTIVNLTGIALSVAAFLLILEYVSFERGANGFHANLPHLYRLMNQSQGGKAYGWAKSPLAPAMKQQFEEVRAYCRIVPTGSGSGVASFQGSGAKEGLASFREEKNIYADPDFFKLFSFRVLAGNPSLQQPNVVALSESKARTYFGTEKALGKVIAFNNQFGKTLFTVSAVFEDVPANSDLQFDMVFSLQTLANPANLNGNTWAKLDEWYGTFLGAVVLLADHADVPALEQKTTAMVLKIIPEYDAKIILQPLQYMHLGKDLNENYDTFGNLGFVYLISSIGILILVIAWLNYINLSTASSLKRAKEVGIRKVAGATRGQIIGQFLGESLLLNTAGLMAALLLVSLFQSSFNHLTGKNLSLNLLLENSAWLKGLLLLVAGLVASGGYVAYLLSTFTTAATLKGTFSKSLKGVFLRKSLVVFQFTISLVLVSATLILYRQLQFMQNQDLGMNLDQLVVISRPQVVGETDYKPLNAAFQNELSRLPYIKKYSNSGVVPGKWYSWSSGGITRPNPRPGDDKKDYSMAIVDNKYLDIYGIKLAAGNNFTPAMCEAGWEKSARVMLNEKAAKELGFASAQDAVGQKIKFGQEYEIIGVIKDYHHQSLRQAIDPMILLPRMYGGNITLQIPGNEVKTRLAALEKLYKQTFPGNPFEYFFVDESFDKQYEAEKQYGLIFILASCLAIFISCLGLFGLSTFTAEQRTKEIGIRKVLGASVTQVVTLLSKDFLKLVLIAFVIATPLAWYAMHKWLQDFAYCIDIHWWIFALAGGLAFLIALLTVSFQAIRAALANPVKSLRTE